MRSDKFDLSRYRERSVREMRPDEQPREKLLSYGSEALTEAELLAILLRTGSKKLNVLDTARALLDHFDGLRNLSRQSWQEMMVIPGIARVKALTLEATFELARRVEVASLGEEIIITSPDMAAAYFSPRLRDLSYEVFYIGFLNNAKALQGIKKISSGGVSATIVDTAEVLRLALLNKARSIILVHNHPSGTTRASAADLDLTKRIWQACDLLSIEVVDHIIIAGDTYVSMRARHGYIFRSN